MVAPILAWNVSGCTTLVQPVGEWGRPADLALDSASLASVNVAVRCGYRNSRDQVRERGSRICLSLEKSLEELGAVIVDGEDGLTPDLTLWYLDLDTPPSSASWASSLGFFLTGGVLPIVTTERSEAELEIVDSKGIVLERQRVRAEVVNAFGWLALARYATQKQPAQARQRELEIRFLRHVQNSVYSRAPKKVM